MVTTFSFLGERKTIHCRNISAKTTACTAHLPNVAQCFETSHILQHMAESQCKKLNDETSCKLDNKTPASLPNIETSLGRGSTQLRRINDAIHPNAISYARRLLRKRSAPKFSLDGPQGTIETCETMYNSSAPITGTHMALPACPLVCSRRRPSARSTENDEVCCSCGGACGPTAKP